ncbi:MAG: aminoglycoside phosphotransferase [Actinomycetia bacterium]|nr:aminoglycoside phosphotransferase [Actinomycetes bacterium]
MAAGRSLRAVWQNQRGGLTYEIDREPTRVFVKWAPPEHGVDLDAELERLRWAAAYVSVPEVLDHGSDDEGAWIATRALPGTNAATEAWRRRPADAVAGLGRALRELHDRLPVAACPFSWSTETRVAELHRRADAGGFDGLEWDRGRLSLDPAAAIRLVDDAPPVDVLVVCHGDACAPNTLLADDGLCTGHVDLGALGIADRWADLAVASWSCDWNYGPGWQDTMFDAYGVRPDPLRIRYYRVLWDLGP